MHERSRVRTSAPAGDGGGLLSAPLPHSLETEKCVLGLFLLRQDLVTLWVGLIDDHLFFRDAHRRLFRAIRRLHEAGHAVDFVTVRNDLQRSDELGEVGGPAYIASLVDGLPPQGDIDTYLQVLADHRKRRELIYFGKKLIDRAYLIGEQSATELFDDADRALFEMRGRHRLHHEIPDQGIRAREFLNSVEVRVQNKHRLLGHSTGLAGLDRDTCGMVGGDLTFIAGSTSAGKTCLALNLVRALCRQRCGTVLFESLEMSQLELQYRMASAEAGINLWRLRKGFATETELQRVGLVANEMAAWSLVIDDSGRVTVPELRSRCRRLATRGLAAVVIDYVQLMESSKRSENRNLELASISRGLKQLAREFSVPIIALSQLTREPSKAKRRPELADLRDSGALEMDADNVWMLFNPTPDDHSTNHVPVELIIAKQRNGPLGTVGLMFEKDCVRFIDQEAPREH